MSDRVRLSLHLPAQPASAGIARGVIRALAPMVSSERLQRAELVTSEIVTNAIRHGSVGSHEDIDIEITADSSALAVTVCDRGPAFEPPAAAPGEQQVGGFGLHIAMTLAEVDITHTAVGNVVSFAVS